MASTNYDLLKAALTTLAADLPTDDDVRKYKAAILIDQYIAALTQQATAVASDISSYSIGGRSVSRILTQAYANTVARLEQELNDIFYGSVTYADFRTTIEASSDV